MIKIKNNNNAVSEVLGSLLLIVISVSLFTVVYVSFFTIDLDQSSPSVTIVGTINDNNLILEHRGGEPLNLKTKVLLEHSEGEREIFTINSENYLENKSKEDGDWDFSEKVIYTLDQITNYSRFSPVDITVVDIVSNSIVMKGTVQEARTADVKISMSVSNNKPMIGEIISITVTASNEKGPSDADGVIIEDVIPGPLKIIDFTTTHGNFNPDSNIWDAGNISVGSTAILVISVKVESAVPISELTQFALIIDGSGSINNRAWNLMKEGLVNSIENEDIFPHDGSVELTVVQFGVGGGGFCARVELGPIIVRQSNYEDIADQISDISQGKGYTPMASGIYLAGDTLSSSNNFGGFNPKNRQVVLLVTDGQPNVVSEQGDLCGDAFDGYSEGRASTEDARNYLINTLSFKDDQDEFNIIGVEGSQKINKEWLRDEIAWPQPGWDTWPPESSGWINVVYSWTEFRDAVDDLFNLLFNRIDNKASIIESSYMDPNSKNSGAVISIYPIS
jgi:uncharacterized repeat protein (TIGR01451 family)